MLRWRIDPEEQAALYAANDPAKRNSEFAAPHPTLSLGHPHATWSWNALSDWTPADQAALSERRGLPPATATMQRQETCCCFVLTRAQLLWWLNAIAFVIHFIAALLTFSACGGEWPRDNRECKGENMEVTIVRLRSQWNSSGADGYDVWVRANDRPSL